MSKTDAKAETKRLNAVQMEILIKNHGSQKAVMSHLNGISTLVDTAYEKAKQTTAQPYFVMGLDGKPFRIDPVSLKFHRLMNKAKKQQGFVSFWSKPTKHDKITR